MAGLTAPQRLVPLLTPYASLDFLVVTVRRTLAVFTAVFFLHLTHVILWLHFANYDRTFWDLDRWLHFGVQPNVWLVERLGSQHDVALLLDWLYIKYFDYPAKNLQHLLWATRWRFVSQGKLPDMSYGVAAMPSLHVAVVVLFAYFLPRPSPWAGLVGVAYAGALLAAPGDHPAATALRAVEQIPVAGTSRLVGTCQACPARPPARSLPSASCSSARSSGARRPTRPCAASASC